MSRSTLRRSSGMPTRTEISVVPAATMAETQAFLPTGVLSQPYWGPPLSGGVRGVGRAGGANVRVAVLVGATIGNTRNTSQAWA